MYGETVLTARGALVGRQAGGEDDVKPIRVITVGDTVIHKDIYTEEMLRNSPQVEKRNINLGDENVAKQYKNGIGQRAG